MAVQYTDVDLMILKRWEEVSALREAFDELIERMGATVELALQRASTHINEKGFVADVDLKAPFISFWKREWVNRNDDGVYGKIVGFAPEEFGREIFPHPTTFLIVEDFSALRMAENAEQFSKALRSAMAEEQRLVWSHDVELPVNPIGREYADVSTLDRVRLVSDPSQLAAFVTTRFDEFLEMVPLVDDTLRKMTRR